MSRRMILVDLCWTRDKDPRVPLGHASILAALRAATTADVRSVVVPVNAVHQCVEDLAEIVLGHARGVASDDVDIAIGVYVWGEELVQSLLPQVRRAGFAGRIILGGPQISYAGSRIDRRYPHADVFVRGYGELALCALVENAGQPTIIGVHYAGTKDRCEQTSTDLALLTSPWLDGAPPGAGSFLRWETQRGCPYRCSFCQHREAGARLRRRALPSARVSAEIDLFCAGAVADIAVLDPIFNLGSHATQVLHRFVERRYGGRLSLQCRAELIDGEFLDAASRLDSRLEFGLQTIHPAESAAVERQNDITKVDAALADVRRRGIGHEVSLIFGLPQQTLASFRESVRWCLERRIPAIKAFPLLLLRGTGLELERDRWGFVDAGGPMPMVVASNTFTEDDWLEMAQIAEALRMTEGQHPSELPELLEIARTLEPEVARWQPRPRTVA